MEHSLKHLQQIASKWPLQQKKNTYPINNPYTQRAIKQKKHTTKKCPLFIKCFHLAILSGSIDPIEQVLVGI
jgi:hypothetical protein